MCHCAGLSTSLAQAGDDYLSDVRNGHAVNDSTVEPPGTNGVDPIMTQNYAVVGLQSRKSSRVMSTGLSTFQHGPVHFSNLVSLNLMGARKRFVLKRFTEHYAALAPLF
jgi:hypothetical protein